MLPGETARLSDVSDFGIEYYDEFDKRQGIVHIIGPEQGFTLPGTTIVCGDSHTATHGAFGALAYGIGTSEVEHVLATQTLIQSKSKNMRAIVEGKLPDGVTAKVDRVVRVRAPGAGGAAELLPVRRDVRRVVDEVVRGGDADHRAALGGGLARGGQGPGDGVERLPAD